MLIIKAFENENRVYIIFFLYRECERRKKKKITNLRERWATGFDRCVFQSVVVVNIKMPY